jgi:hypothetical protein
LADKIAFRDQIEATGGLDVAEMLLGSPKKSQLQRYYDPNCPDMPRIDTVRRLEDLTRGSPGWPHMTRLHAREHGFTLVALPCADGVKPADLHAALGKAIKEFNDVSMRLIEALGDGKVTPSEADQLMQDCTEAAEAVLCLRQLLAQIAGEG